MASLAAPLWLDGLGRHVAKLAAAGTLARVAPWFTKVPKFSGSDVRDRKAVQGDIEQICTELPWLGERRHQQAGTLSGGEQQMLALGRARLTRPRLILLDEPSLGLAPLVVQSFFEVVQRLNAEDGVTLLVVEQNASIALDVSHRAYVLEVGRVALTGESASLAKDEAIRSSYLGY